MGLDPRGSNGVTWDGNALTVDQIYKQDYANKVDTTPWNGPDGTGTNAGKKGFLFFDWASTGAAGVKEHMEYCEISADGLSYTQWYTDGVKTPEKHTFAFAKDKNGFATHLFSGLDVFPRI